MAAEHSTFTPGQLSPATLEALFVVREPLVRGIMDGIRASAASGNKHQRLLIGPRGSGKSHLVALVYHRVRADRELAARLRIAWLPEDPYAVGYAGLLTLVLRRLRQDEGDLDWLDARLEAILDLAALPQQESALEDLLLQALDGRTLLLIIENLDALFGALREDGQRKLRAFIQNHGLVSILASTTSLTADLSGRKKTFYGFFRTHMLEPFGVAAAADMLARLALHKGDPDLANLILSPLGLARVRALHDLASGNPRVYKFFFDFLTCDSLDDLVAPFMGLMESLTPYYQARMSRLPPLQRGIIDTLRRLRGAVPVKEIARQVMATSQTVSAQLAKLVDLGDVMRADSLGRSNYYELREPLMRLCLEVKEQRGEPVGLFVQFLRVWYSRTELDRLADPAGEAAADARLREAAARARAEAEALALLAKPQPAYPTRQEFQRALHQADTLLWLDRWEEGAAALDRLLAESRPPAWTSRDLWVIGSLVLRTQNPQIWRRFIALWLDCFVRHGRLTELGEALVRSLRHCAVAWVTDQTAQAWCAAWRDLAGDRAELALPLRLLAAGVAYRADRDPRVLLDLPQEERGLLEPWLINLYQDQPDQTDRDLDDLLQRVAARLDQEARQAQARAYWEAPAPTPDHIDLDAVLVDYGAPPAPGPARLLPGPWETLDRTAAAALLRRLADRCVDGARALARPGLRVLAVLRRHPGFSDHDLYQVQVMDGQRPGALDLLAGAAEVRLLDGLAQTLFDLVEFGTIRLDTPAAQSDYTRFFCNVLRVDAGRLQVIDGLDDLPLAVAPPPAAQAVPPWELERLDQDGRPVYAGTVLFGTDLFPVTLALHPRSGRVELLADEPVAEDLPIRREGFDGPIRYLAEAGSTAAAVP